jgi:signal transduction histidine kinase
VARTDEGTIKSRYGKLADERGPYLSEAYRSALVTLPALVPDEQDIRDRTAVAHDLAKPHQSLGARGVNNLASKLLLTLFPPTTPFLRYEIILGEDDADDVALREKIQGILARREAAIQRELDTTGARVKLFAALKHLIVAGNTLIYLEPDGSLQVFPLNAYACKRDTIGNPVEVIYVEAMDRATVQDPAILDALEKAPKPEHPDDPNSVGDQPVHVYTHLQWEGKKLTARKEVAGLIYDEESYKAEDSPWLPLRFTAIDGEDYGRGFVEEYRGDLTGLEELSKAVVFAAANAAMMIPLIHPNGSVKPRQFQNAQNGEAIIGRPDDVSFVTADKFADMQVANAAKNDLVQALSADFMLNSAFQRQAERVTAEEIRRMAEELEDTLGGTFSVLSQELQLPIARRIEKALERRGRHRPGRHRPGPRPLPSARVPRPGPGAGDGIPPDHRLHAGGRNPPTNRTGHWHRAARPPHRRRGCRAARQAPQGSRAEDAAAGPHGQGSRPPRQGVRRLQLQSRRHGRPHRRRTHRHARRRAVTRKKNHEPAETEHPQGRTERPGREAGEEESPGPRHWRRALPCPPHRVRPAPERGLRLRRARQGHPPTRRVLQGRRR